MQVVAGRLFILRHVFYNMERKKFFFQMELFYPMFTNCIHVQNIVGRKPSRLGEIRFGQVGEVSEFAEVAEIPENAEIAN